MSYDSPKKATELDLETTLANADVIPFGKADDSGKAHGIEWEDFVELLKRNNVHVTSEASSATPTATGDRQRSHHYVTALAENTTIQVPSGTGAVGNFSKYTILNGGTLRTLAAHASILDPYARMPDEIPANGRADILLEYNGSAWVIIEAVATT